MYYKKIQFNSKNNICQLIKYYVRLRKFIYLYFLIILLIIILIYKIYPSKEINKIYSNQFETLKKKFFFINKNNLEEINKKIWQSFNNEQKQNWVNFIEN
jgi:hypothetical protein